MKSLTLLSTIFLFSTVHAQSLPNRLDDTGYLDGNASQCEVLEINDRVSFVVVGPRDAQKRFQAADLGKKNAESLSLAGDLMRSCRQQIEIGCDESALRYKSSRARLASRSYEHYNNCVFYSIIDAANEIINPPAPQPTPAQERKASILSVKAGNVAPIDYQFRKHY